MSSVRLAALAALVGYTSFCGAAVQAQVYRIVGPDGRVTFSDRPPAEAQAATPQPQPLANAAEGTAAAPLPAELRAAASRFPVVLYTGSGCTPCDSARAYLVGRGVPFTEKTVTTDADARVLRDVSGDLRVPFATVGRQHLVGFGEFEWAQYLDAAGYPKTSALPAAYRNPPPTPLVALEAARPAAAQAPAPASMPRPVAPQPLPSDVTPANPTGIRF